MNWTGKLCAPFLVILLVITALGFRPASLSATLAGQDGGPLRIGHPDAWPGFADEAVEELLFVETDSPSLPTDSTPPDSLPEVPPTPVPRSPDSPPLPLLREAPGSESPTPAPILLTARASWADTMGEGAETWPVEGVSTLSFWNVGSQVPGCGEAVLETVIFCAATGESGTIRLTGTFSGGPDGHFRLRGEHGEVAFQLIRGEIVETLDPQLGRLRVDKPEAFAPWRK